VDGSIGAGDVDGIERMRGKEKRRRGKGKGRRADGPIVM
jgi:hypothetical protein